MNSTTKKTIFDPQNNLSFDDRVIQKMILLLLKDIDGIFLNQDLVEAKGIHVDVGAKQVAIDLTITCEFGKNIPAIFQEILEILTLKLKEMTGLSLIELNLHVDDILIKEPITNDSSKPLVKTLETTDDSKIEESPLLEKKLDTIDVEVVAIKPKKAKATKVVKTKKTKKEE